MEFVEIFGSGSTPELTARHTNWEAQTIRVNHLERDAYWCGAETRIKSIPKIHAPNDAAEMATPTAENPTMFLSILSGVL